MGEIVELIERFEVKENGDYKFLDTVHEIIRCRDCEYYEDFSEFRHEFNCLHRHGMVDPDGNDFCSVGERRHEQKDN